RYGLSHTALLRHKFNCVPRTLVQARNSKTIVEADFLLSKVSRLMRAAETVLDMGEKSGDFRMILSAVRELRPTIELLSRLAGQLGPAGEADPLLVADHRARQIKLSALQAYPEARVAVSAALSEQAS